jgi:FkbM family methyltransferase
LSAGTRWIGSLRLRGTWQLVQPLRRYYAKHYRASGAPYTLIRNYDGDLKLRLNRASQIDGNIYWLGYHSFDERILLDKLLKPGDVFCDVGANIGELTLYAAKRLTAGKVLAFEPAGALHQRLLGNVQLNNFSNVSTYHLGLSDRPGEVKLYNPTFSQNLDNIGSFSEGEGSVFKSDSRPVTAEVVRVETFDKIFAETKLDRLDIIKIDVEGAELSVLHGARAALERYKPAIVIEINEETYSAAGYTYKDVVDFLDDLNYTIFLAETHGNPIRRIELVKLPELNKLPLLGTLLAT